MRAQIAPWLRNLDRTGSLSGAAAHDSGLHTSKDRGSLEDAVQRNLATRSRKYIPAMQGTSEKGTTAGGLVPLGVNPLKLCIHPRWVANSTWKYRNAIQGSSPSKPGLYRKREICDQESVPGQGDLGFRILDRFGCDDQTLALYQDLPVKAPWNLQNEIG